MSEKSGISENEAEYAADSSYSSGEEYDEEDEGVSDISDPEIKDEFFEGQNNNGRNDAVNSDQNKDKKIDKETGIESSEEKITENVANSSIDLPPTPVLKQKRRKRKSQRAEDLDTTQEDDENNYELTQSGRRKRKCVLNQQQRLSLLSREEDSNSDDSPNVYGSSLSREPRMIQPGRIFKGRRGRPSKGSINSKNILSAASALPGNNHNMRPNLMYVFNSSLANAAARAVLSGNFPSIVDFHSQIHFPNNRISYEEIQPCYPPPNAINQAHMMSNVASMTNNGSIPGNVVSNGCGGTMMPPQGHHPYRQTPPTQMHQMSRNTVVPPSQGHQMPPLQQPYRLPNSGGIHIQPQQQNVRCSEPMLQNMGMIPPSSPTNNSHPGYSTHPLYKNQMPDNMPFPPQHPSEFSHQQFSNNLSSLALASGLKSGAPMTSHSGYPNFNGFPMNTSPSIQQNPHMAGVSSHESFNINQNAVASLNQQGHFKPKNLPPLSSVNVPQQQMLRNTAASKPRTPELQSMSQTAPTGYNQNISSDSSAIGAYERAKFGEKSENSAFMYHMGGVSSNSQKFSEMSAKRLDKNSPIIHD